MNIYIYSPRTMTKILTYLGLIFIILATLVREGPWVQKVTLASGIIVNAYLFHEHGKDTHRQYIESLLKRK